MASEFHRFLTGLSLRHFSAAELAFLGARHQDNGLNREPPPHLWRRIVPTAWIADQARHAIGHPIRILSAYRSPAYNSAVGGAAQSRHMKFDALDLDPMDVPAQDLFDLLLNLRGAGLFRGGLGLYPHFVHLDTRGENALWGA